MPRELKKIDKIQNQENGRVKGNFTNIVPNLSFFLSFVCVCVSRKVLLVCPTPVQFSFSLGTSRPRKWICVGRALSLELHQIKNPTVTCSSEAIHILQGRRENTRKHTHTPAHAESSVRTALYTLATSQRAAALGAPPAARGTPGSPWFGLRAGCPRLRPSPGRAQTRYSRKRRVWGTAANRPGVAEPCAAAWKRRWRRLRARGRVAAWPWARPSPQ